MAIIKKYKNGKAIKIDTKPTILPTKPPSVIPLKRKPKPKNTQSPSPAIKQRPMRKKGGCGCGKKGV